MKKSAGLLLVFILSLSVFVSSCGEDDATPFACASCTKTPNALPANDASSKGIYKGILIGSSGTIMFDIANAGSLITAVMVVDGTTVNLTATISWVQGQPFVSDFTGTMNGAAVTINFSVGADGGSPTVNSSNIPGHPNAVLTVVKETSNQLVECFEGTYSTTEPESGTFNIMLSRSAGLWGGIARETGSTTADDVEGTISNGKILMDGNEIGTLSGDAISGTFTTSSGFTATINGQRTL
jgi:hypothetical protein